MEISRLFKIISLGLILCGAIQASAQDTEHKRDSILQLIQTTKVDSIKSKQYLVLSNLFLYYNPKIGIKYAQKALEYGQKGNYSKGIFHAYGALFTGHHVQGSNTDSLLKYVQLFEKQAIKNGQETDMMGVYFNYAMYYGSVGKSDKEIEAYLKSLKLVQKYQPESSREAAILNNIGIIYYSKKQHKEALKYYQAALKLVTNRNSKANLLANCGSIYMEDAETIDSAQIFFDEAMEIYAAENDLSGIAFVLIYKAKYQDSKQQYERAYQIYTEAFEIINDNDFGYLLPTIYQVIARHFYIQEKYQEAISYAEKTIEIAIDEQENFTDIDGIYELLHDSYAEVGNYKRAYEVQKDLMILSDSINNLELQSKVETLKTEFEVGQKDAENKLLKLSLQTRKRLLIILILALTFAIALGIFGFRSSQQRKKYNEILEYKVIERTKDLEQANYELRTFNYIASHGIKEPIRVIGGYAGLIFRKLPNDLKESLVEYFDTIKRSTNQLYTLIEDFTNYTKMSKNEVIETQTVDLNSLVFNVIDNLQDTIKKYKGTIEVLNLPTIETGNSLLFITLKNLIENGLKYNKSETPTVNINYQKTATHHEIIVSDNGIGINKKYHEHVFEMFKRLHNREKYEGSGIGLAIVKLSVEKLGGTINLESEEGKGCRFVIELPLKGFLIKNQ